MPSKRKDQPGESKAPHEAELLRPAGVQELSGTLVGRDVLIRVNVQQVVGADGQVNSFSQLIAGTQICDHFTGEYLLIGHGIGGFGDLPEVYVAEEGVKFPGAQVEGQVELGAGHRLFQENAAGLVEVDVLQPFQLCRSLHAAHLFRFGENAGEAGFQGAAAEAQVMGQHDIDALRAGVDGVGKKVGLLGVGLGEEPGQFFLNGKLAALPLLYVEIKQAAYSRPHRCTTNRPACNPAPLSKRTVYQPSAR